jgi:hypothetical protein
LLSEIDKFVTTSDQDLKALKVPEALEVTGTLEVPEALDFPEALEVLGAFGEGPVAQSVKKMKSFRFKSQSKRAKDSVRKKF